MSVLVRKEEAAEPPVEEEAPAPKSDAAKRLAEEPEVLAFPPPAKAIVLESAQGPTRSQAAGADQALGKAVESIEAILWAIRTQTPFTLSHVEEAVDALRQNLQATDALLVPFFGGGRYPASPGHEAANVCILALKIGMELGFSAVALGQLALAALLQDIGMARLPEEFLGRSGPLSAAERAALRQSPEEGARLLRASGLQYHWLAEGLLQVHERRDGSGYPRGLQGEGILEFAQIVGLADVYESLVHHRPFRRCLGPVQALKEILHRERAAFPDRILKALIRGLTTFPVGSLVRLNTGEIGRVVAKHPDFPLRPLVEVLLRQGKPMDDPLLIDLSKNPLLHVQESVVEDVLEQEASRERA